MSRDAFGKYKFQIVILVVLGFITSLLEGIGINALIPLFSFILNDGAGDDLISRAIASFFSFINISPSVIYLLIFISVLFFLKAITTVIFDYIKIYITSDYEEKTRGTLLSRILESDWSYLLKQKLGYLETVLMIDVRASAVLLRQISAAIMQITSLLIYALVAINISPTITLLAFVIGAVLFLLLKPIIYKIKLSAQKMTDINKEVAHFANENIVGIKTIKGMAVEKEILRNGQEYFYKLKKVSVRILSLQILSVAFINPVSIIFICFIFAFTYKSSNFSFASLAAIVYLVGRIFAYLQQLQGNFHTINELIPYLRSVVSYEHKAIINKEIDNGSAPFVFNKNLEFKNVNFSYNEGKEILPNINFSIKKGEVIGLIGPSGVGKTTLVDLILRLFEPSKGQILLDGKNIDKISLRRWRKNIGYVSQDMFLMNDTIANNIIFHDESISEQEVEQATKMANIYDFIQECPDKLDTMIGERGILLSAGQRQRIVIARILVRNPQLIILDEATSALDVESEMEIQGVINNLKGHITVFVVAHRLSTIVDSDRLIVLGKGKIVEQGKPKELLENKDSYFYKMYNLRNN